jgi:hypothetical protein
LHHQGGVDYLWLRVKSPAAPCKLLLAGHAVLIEDAAGGAAMLFFVSVRLQVLSEGSTSHHSTLSGARS